MLTTKELRQGNKILWGDYPYIETVTAILSDDFIQCDPLSADRTIDEFKPIPLTPEILEKCGFKRYDIGETADEDAWILPVDPSDENNYLSRFTLTDEMEYSFMDEGTGRSNSIKITSLHQLQNLYFALIGEELQVELIAENC